MPTMIMDFDCKGCSQAVSGDPSIWGTTTEGLPLVHAQVNCPLCHTVHNFTRDHMNQ